METPPALEPLSEAARLLQDRPLSPEERSRVLSQIEAVVEQERQPLGEEAFVVRPRRRGVLLPLLINGVAASLVALGILALAYTFRLRQGALSLRGGELASAEGRLLEVFRRQSESRLQEQTAEVERARVRLRALERERRAAQPGGPERTRQDQELQRLFERQQQERLFADQLRAVQALVLQALRAEDYTEAERQLAALRGLLADPARGGPVDRGLAEALAELAALRTRPAPSFAASAAAAAAVAESAAPDPALARRLEKTEQEAASSQRQLADLRRQAADRQARLSEAQRQVTDRDRQIQELKQKADRLAAQLASVNSRADSLDKETKAFGPQAQAAADKAARLARESAFKDVIAFVDSLKERSSSRSAELAAQGRQEPLFANLMREIQILAAGSGLGSAGARAVLLGTVSSVSGETLVVEPLGTVTVKAGARVQIRRGSAGEAVVARGVVQQVGEGRFTVLLDAGARGASGPAAMDSVYPDGSSAP